MPRGEENNKMDKNYSFYGGPARIRTEDQGIMSPLL